ncbi:MAG: UDP-N-acetylmuramoyl-L-alanyl-D-glutamate--2,6-diaminopimelate ligase [Oceanospirillaceae bacterium]
MNNQRVLPTQVLANLFAQYAHLANADKWLDVEVTGIKEDSRNIVKGDLFVARDGEFFKGTQYIKAAASNGAIAALVEKTSTINEVDLEHYPIPVIAIDKLHEQVGAIAAKVFNNVAQQLTIIGITGTNGKTSCAHYLAQSLNNLAINTFIIGTLGNGHPKRLQVANRTTPDACALQQLFAEFYHQGAKAVVMEVSSHALEQGRVAGTQFNAVAYTNLSRDHLDYHGSMQAYAAAKARLFTQFNADHRILNISDAYNRELLTSLSASMAQSIVTYSEDADKDANVSAADVCLEQGLKFNLELPGRELKIDSQIIGKFNIANLLLCASVLIRLGFSDQQIQSSLNQLTPVPGRMQKVIANALLPSDKLQPLCVVDYAHTPDALEKALQACRIHCSNENAVLKVVFGCGGDRDTGKRAEMAEIAERFADYTIVTSDNPRTEDPDSIIKMVCLGFSKGAKFKVNSDRKQAIFDAIATASSQDVVLIAGKGHEDYQEIMQVKHPFLDAQIVVEAIEYKFSLTNSADGGSYV